MSEKEYERFVVQGKPVWNVGGRMVPTYIMLIVKLLTLARRAILRGLTLGREYWSY